MKEILGGLLYLSPGLLPLAGIVTGILGLVTHSDALLGITLLLTGASAHFLGD